jgi:FkbM family methyltransferase
MIVVQIGTNNGNDHVRDFCCIHKPSKVILVEPFSIHYDDIQKNYSGIENVVTEMIAITPNSEKLATLFYSIADGPSRGPGFSYQVTSMIAEHLLIPGHGHYSISDLRPITVEAMTINELFIKHNLHKIDYLFLDIEGIDFEILEMIDFSKFDIKNIQIEILHLDKVKLDTFMNKHGYISTNTTLDKEGYDMLYRKVN